MVPSRRRNLERPFRFLLTAHFIQEIRPDLQSLFIAGTWLHALCAGGSI
jgi:hypothetical protein